MLKTRRRLFIGVLTSAVWVFPVLALAVLPFVASAPNAAAQTPSPDTTTAPALLIKGAVKQELRLRISGQRLGSAFQHHAWRLVAAHHVEGDDDPRAQARLPRDACREPDQAVSDCVATTSRPS